MIVRVSGGAGRQPGEPSTTTFGVFQPRRPPYHALRPWTLSALDAKITAVVEPVAGLVELVCTIPGVAPNTAHVLLAECGWDMSVFPNAGRLASWAGICPGNNASGGKRLSGATRPGSRWLRKALTQAAQAAARPKGTYLAAHHAQIRGRQGSAKAIGATDADTVVAVLDRLAGQRGAPAHLRMDNGPELIAWALRDWCRLGGTGTVTSSRARRGRTRTSSRSTAGSATNCSTSRSSAH